jgi:hypothetical protein
MVKMTRCLRDDPGSIPGEGANFRPRNPARPQPKTDMTDNTLKNKREASPDSFQLMRKQQQTPADTGKKSPEAGALLQIAVYGDVIYG